MESLRVTVETHRRRMPFGPLLLSELFACAQHAGRIPAIEQGQDGMPSISMERIMDLIKTQRTVRAAVIMAVGQQHRSAANRSPGIKG